MAKFFTTPDLKTEYISKFKNLKKKINTNEKEKLERLFININIIGISKCLYIALKEKRND